MLKYFIIGIASLIVLIILGIIFLINYMNTDENTILQFIEANPNKSAITWYRNDNLMVDRNSKTLMPLASTVKTIIAIEYAHQAANGIIDPDQLIDTSELEAYHVKNTDGGAHKSWLSYRKSGVEDNKVSIRHIAKGMITHSSNANTEWMCTLLGLEKVNARLDSLGISEDHDEIYHLVSSLFIGKELYPDLSGDQLKQKLYALDYADYIKPTYTIHEKLISDPKYKYNEGDNSLSLQKVWSDRLARSTTYAYASVMKKLNSKSDFDAEVYKYLDEVMEVVMENPRNASWLKHSGSKGGSTASILAEALYATDKKGNTTELAYFFNDLSLLENRRMAKGMNSFNLRLLNNEEFRTKVIETLK